MTATLSALPFSLDGEVALVTGGGSGLGLAMARCLHAAGAKVVLAGRRADLVEAEAQALGDGAYAETVDITAFDEMEAFVARVEARVGPISILVNNAGNHLKKLAVDTPVEEFATVMDTHVLAAHNLTRYVLPGMIARGRGNILFIASMTSFIGIPQVIAYSAAKSAYVGMVRALSAEVAEHGVRVNAIAPGWIESPMLRKALSGDEARAAKILSRTPMKRFGQADDIGWAAVYLCSPAAQFVTGVVLPVDGGAAQGF
ncbi:SDR family NAD(P)-dependent oxidoreductase [Asticcacaulis sp. 201]|uniref:SDR family NAD(P)-dependent oxidoreductase n=1 Tax=Asticcacaulis sp. 201 TaxID=3028787 RepID=UPI002916FBA2|nr:SDR family oxidoreductase [Asticcacaulis sp. 201]MDV6330224.1 SDR family oxidoreductase [Asticcacaulis sp. 201]